ncbi:MAG: NAD(P)H-dependent oxidoreductase [Pseudohongiella sp.]|nr:NAD(P)H-dependent oxidoreductase [Pseudohongiella sp.]
MMSKRILVIQGHPDNSAPHLNHALADAYSNGARAAGHEVRVVTVSALDFPLLRSQHDWEHGEVPATLKTAQEDILWAEHLVVYFPLWLGGMPAVLRAFLEQVLRPGFAFSYSKSNPMGVKGLKGRSARIVVTMGMPSLFYKWFFRAHSLKALKRNILGFVGIAPIRQTVIGMSANLKPEEFKKLLGLMQKLGRAGL